MGNRPDAGRGRKSPGKIAAKRVVMPRVNYRDSLLVNAALAGPDDAVYPRLVQWALGLSPPAEQGDETRARFLIFGEKEGVDEDFLLLCRRHPQHPLKPLLEQLAKQGFASLMGVPTRDANTRAANFRVVRASFVAQWPTSFASFLAQSRLESFGFGDDEAAKLACLWAILHSTEALSSCQWDGEPIREQSKIDIVGSALSQAIRAGRLRISPAQAKTFLDQLVRLLGKVPAHVDGALEHCFSEPAPKTGWDRFSDGDLQDLAAFSPSASFALGTRRLLPLRRLASEVEYLHGVAERIPTWSIGFDAMRFRTEEDPVARWALHYAHREVSIKLDPLDEHERLFPLLVGGKKQGVSEERQQEARCNLHDDKFCPPHEQVVSYTRRCSIS